jgi:hypothetical protein
VVIILLPNTLWTKFTSFYTMTGAVLLQKPGEDRTRSLSLMAVRERRPTKLSDPQSCGSQRSSVTACKIQPAGVLSKL